MNFEPKTYLSEKIGKVIGFCFSYLLFTAAVYFIFFRTGPGFGGIPSDYAMATMSTLAMVAAGLAVKKLIT